MRKRLVTKSFHKLNFETGSKNVEKYYEKMLSLLEEINLYVDEEATMNRSTKDLMRRLQR